MLLSASQAYLDTVDCAQEAHYDHYSQTDYSTVMQVLTFLLHPDFPDAKVEVRTQGKC